MNTATATVPGMDATPAAAWRAYQGVTPSAVDEKDLIERYLPLVRNVVDRIKLNVPAHVDADDLYSVGITGLLAAVRKFDPEQGNTFASYAAMRIRGAILDELRRMDWCPRRARARSRKLKTAINTVEQRFGRAATDEEVRAELAIDPKEYEKWVEEAKPVTFINIDHELKSEEGGGPPSTSSWPTSPTSRGGTPSKSRSFSNFSLNASRPCPIYQGRFSRCTTSKTCASPKSPRCSGSPSRASARSTHRPS